MPAYNFQPRFVDAIKSGFKRSTIRATRLDGRVPRPGQELQLYTGMRTKNCQRLRLVKCARVSKLTISVALAIRLNGRLLNGVEEEHLVKQDGFTSTEDFFLWFKEYHGFPFQGHVVEW